MDSCFVLLGTHQHCVAKICNASPRAKAHNCKVPRLLYFLPSISDLCPIISSLVQTKIVDMPLQFIASSKPTYPVKTTVQKHTPFKAKLLKIGSPFLTKAPKILYVYGTEKGCIPLPSGETNCQGLFAGKNTDNDFSVIKKSY